MKELLKKVERNEIKAIYIYKLDRISRSVVDIYNMLSFFIEHNTDLNAIADNINIQSANGRLFVGILAIIAQWESEVTSERTMNSKYEMISQGFYPHGRKIFGYKKNGKVLVFDEEECEVVENIYMLLSTGMVIKEVEKELSTTKYKLSAESIKHIAMDRKYLGEFEYNGIVYNDIIPKMIDRDTFELVQSAVNKRLKVADNTKYYFGNKVVACNRILVHEMSKKKEKNYYYYRSPESKQRINQDKIIDQILYRILDYANQSDKKAKREKKVKQLNAIDKKIRRLHDKYILSKVNSKEYLIALTRLEVEKDPLMTEVNILIENNFFRWGQLTDAEKKAFIDTYIKKIEVDLDLQIVVNLEYK